MITWSQLERLDYNCYEVGHTWTPSCAMASAAVCVDAFISSTKMYTTVYVLTLLLRAKRITWDTVKRTLLDILQSSCFLTWNGFAFVSYICIFRWLLGHFYIANAGFLPGFMSSLMAIMIERKRRRRLLAVYVLNVILDAFYRMAVYRKRFTPIPHGEVYLFSISIAGFLYLYRKREDLHDFTAKILSFIIEKEEGGSPIKKSSLSDDVALTNEREKLIKHYIVPKSILNSRYWSQCTKFINYVQNLLKKGPHHSLCLHKHSCHYYWLQAFLRLFLIGYGAQRAFLILTSLPKLLKNPSLPKSLFLDQRSLKFGAFLGSFAAVFKMVNCCLRWLRDKDTARHGLIAGCIAGMTMMIYPMPSVALYTFCKLLDILYMKGIRAGYCPSLPAGVELFYALVTGLMFHVAVLEPHNLRPSYWKFLLRLTAGRIAGINRHLLEPFGTHSGKMFATKVYNYNPEFTSAHLKNALQITPIA